MQQKSIEERAGCVIDLIKEYFGDSITMFYIVPEKGDRACIIECLAYRSFKVEFYLGDVSSRDFEFGVGVYVSDKAESLDVLARTGDEGLPRNEGRDSIIQNLEVLDEYLQWRMTDAQKKTFGLL